MPEISRFYGIIIQMFFKDHNPPHFHVSYGEYRAIVSIETGLVEGKMPARALKMVFEWLEIHKDELLQNWELAQNGQLPNSIEPLN
ncbi:protein of unknown function [Cruoricaptor ignavus]|uniref:DUF4160 domain-containing protein n=1 Tax=Cruoricaptor ignavus TaxID=1118202 RepID=A0A1M6CCE9_9FLAO|nr:DUF4160 domain-containing protein [Cruoricaptor ignavus]QOR73919.1 DUF4160 domain-containing protein [Cruoricaptor ignavus]SHI58679.1 protein of unknown function [Cruoricaptor ignavus]